LHLRLSLLISGKPVPVRVQKRVAKSLGQPDATQRNRTLEMKSAIPLQWASAISLALISQVYNGKADDWPQWIGPQRDGVWREKGVVERFSADGPPVLWRTPVNRGYCGPTVANGRIFLLDRQPGPRLERKPGDRAIPMAAGNERVLIFIWNDQGELITGRLTPKGFVQISCAKLLETSENTRGRDITWCPPAFANRCLYVHNGKELICVSLAAPS